MKFFPFEFPITYQFILILMLTFGSLTNASDQATDVVPAPSNHIGVMMGKHGYNAPFLVEAIKPRGIFVDRVTGWIDSENYEKYGVLILDGNLKEAGHEKNTFDPQDIERLTTFIENGGTFILIRQGLWAFNTEHGKAFLEKLVGSSPKHRLTEPTKIQYQHPWVSHITDGDVPEWITARNGAAVYYNKGNSIIELVPNRTYLHHSRLGDGQLIYIAWNIFSSRPPGRVRIDPERERLFNEQIRIVENIAADLFPNHKPPLPNRMLFDSPYQLPSNMTRELYITSEYDNILSHQPTRPLPVASDRPMASGPAKFVDAQNGNDQADGSKHSPWQTVQHAINQLNPGDTLYLREGIYYEHVVISNSGESDKPITIRSYPNDLVILDGGLRDFYESPDTAWLPYAEGVEGEYVSTRTYPGLGSRAKAVNLLGNFGDSMIPLHGYWFIGDLRTDNPYWTMSRKTSTNEAMYCGPGIWYNPETQRIHCRLAHTHLPGLGDDNYRGETDPRRVPLVIGRNLSPMSLVGARHIRLQDLVLRGSSRATLNISASADIELDGLTIYAGRTCVAAEYTQGFRMVNSALRGISAPWTSRSSLKYRSVEAGLFSASGWKPTNNSDFELAYSEFTDSIDGIYLGNVANVRFHHNLVDNMTDDGMFLTATATNLGEMPGGPILIYQNRFSRCTTTFGFGVGHGRQTSTDAGTMTGAGIWIFRNIFDYRQAAFYGQPIGPDKSQEITTFGRSLMDHGSPIWEPIFFYQNTIIARDPAFRSYYVHGFGGHMRDTVRVVLNNIYVQLKKPLGIAPTGGGFALMIDGNLHWGVEDSKTIEQLHAAVKKNIGKDPLNVNAFPRKLINPQTTNPETSDPLTNLIELAGNTDDTPYRAQHDQIANPNFILLEEDWRITNDYRLNPDSPALGAGVKIPADWPDPLYQEKKPDIGAIPVGHAGWRVGQFGRFNIATHPN